MSRRSASTSGAGCSVGGPLHEGRLGDEVTERDVKGVGECGDDREPVQLDPIVFDFAQPVHGLGDQACEDFLGHPASPPVSGDPLADGESVRHATHAVSLTPTSRKTPEGFSRLPTGQGQRVFTMTEPTPSISTTSGTPGTPWPPRLVRALGT